MTLKKWIGVILLQMVPIVNFIILMVWAFSSQNETLRNYSRALLIVTSSVMVVTLFLMLTVTAIRG